MRTATGGLRALAAGGLAVCDVDGRWSSTGQSPTADLAQAVARARAARTSTVTADRAAYRRSGGASAWSIARAAAAKAQQVKETAWWGRLSRDERLERRAAWQARYVQLTVREQHDVKSGLARRRAGRGVDEAAHHDAWIDTWSDEAWTERVISRTVLHRHRPAPEQVALVDAWDRHRRTWGVPRGSTARATRTEHQALLPDRALVRDDAWLADQAPLPDLADTRTGT